MDMQGCILQPSCRYNKNVTTDDTDIMIMGQGMMIKAGHTKGDDNWIAGEHFDDVEINDNSLSGTGTGTGTNGQDRDHAKSHHERIWNWNWGP